MKQKHNTNTRRMNESVLSRLESDCGERESISDLRLILRGKK